MDTQRPDLYKKRHSEQIHLKDYLAVIRKRKKVVILFSVVLVGLASAYSFLARPVYQATAQIIIERQPYPITHSEEALNADIRESDFYQTQYELLQARSLALKVIKKLDLWKQFSAAQPPKELESLYRVMSEANTGAAKPIRQTGPAPIKGQAVPPFSDWSDAIDWYLDSLKIDSVRGTRLINISFTSTSPETAAQVANVHAHAFIEKSTQTKIAASQQKLNWLKKLPPEKGNKTRAHALKPSSVEDKNIFSLPEVAQDPVILNLRNQLIQLKAKRLELATNFGPKHPKMVDLNDQIRETNKELVEEAKRLSRAVNTSLEDSTIRIVDEAEIPLIPVRPKRLLNIFLALFMSMFLGPFLAFFVEYMDKTVKTPEDVQRRLGMAVLGAVPSYRLKKRNGSLLTWEASTPGRKKLYSYPGDTAVRFIPNLLSIRKQSMGKVLFIESATIAEGKTTVLANSALSLAKRGIRVLVIDADIFNPALHSAFHVRNDSGLVTVMSEILSEKIVNGNLNTHSVADLFFLIALNRLRGMLTITNDSQAMTVVFEDGRLMHIQSTKSPSDNRLGTMLVRGGLLTQSQLEEAVEWHKRSGQPLGYILINAGFLTQDRLQGPIKLHVEEHLQRLFSWKQGDFRFENGLNAKTYEDEKIYCPEDYAPIIHRYASASDSRFIEQRLFSGITPTSEQNIWLLPAGTANIKPTAGPVPVMLFSKFLEILKHRFDVIFVDAPPVLDMPDSTALSSLGDGVMFVVKAGKLSDRKIMTAAERLRESGSNVLGVVLNSAKFEKGEHV